MMSLMQSRFSFVVLLAVLFGCAFPVSGDAKEPPPTKPETEPRENQEDQFGNHSTEWFFRRGLFPRSPETKGKPWQLESRQPRSQISSVSWHPEGQLLAVGEAAGCVRIYNPVNWDLVTVLYCQGRVGAVSYSPDGQWLAATTADRLNVTTMSRLKIWRADGTANVETTFRSASVANLAWSPDSQRIATVTNYRDVRVVDLNGETKLVLRGHEDTIKQLAWSPRGDKIASASRDGQMRVWHLSQAVPKRDRRKDLPEPVAPNQEQKLSATSKTYQGDKAITKLKWMRDGKSLACAERSGRVFLQHLSGQSETISGQQRGLRSVAPHRDGQRLAVSGWKSFNLFDLSDKSYRVLKDPNWVHDMSWHPQKDRLAVINGNGISILDLEKNQVKTLAKIESSRNQRPLAWSPDGKLFTCATSDSWLRFWKADGRGVAREWKIPGHRVPKVSWSSSNRRLATWSIRDKVRLWTIDGETGPIFEDLRGFHKLVWSPEGKILAIVSVGGTFRFANDQGKILSVHREEESERHVFQWSPQSDLLAIAGTGDRARIKLLGTDGKIVKAMNGNVSKIRGLDWHPQGNRLAAIDYEGTVRVWNVKDTKSSIMGQHKKSGRSVAWSPNGKWLASSSTDIRIWNSDGRLQTTIDPDAHSFFPKLAWHPQSKWIAAQIPDRMVRLWKPGGEPGPSLYGTALARESMAWSPGGEWIACSTRNHSVIVWDTATGATRWVGLELPGGKSAVVDSQRRLLVEDMDAFDKQFVFVERIDGKNVLKTAAQWLQETTK